MTRGGPRWRGLALVLGPWATSLRVRRSAALRTALGSTIALSCSRTGEKSLAQCLLQPDPQPLPACRECEPMSYARHRLNSVDREGVGGVWSQFLRRQDRRARDDSVFRAEPVSGEER